MRCLYPLLLAIPIAVYLEMAGASPLWIFISSALAILPLAGVLGKATEELAIHAGPRFGGFLNATFGNAAELIITIMAIRAGLFELVKASITGAIIGNILLILGLSAVVGGFKNKVQVFNRNLAVMNSSLLFLSVIALTIPAIFVLGGGIEDNELGKMSRGVADILMATYVLSLVFSFRTHKHLFHTAHEVLDEAEWSRNKALTIMILSTVGVALMSEFLVGSLEEVISEFGVSEFFLGIVIIPLIGNAAEHSSAIMMALRNRMDLALEIAIGSSTQIAVFVAPLLIYISYLVGKPMSYIFNVYELTAIALTVLIANIVSSDGETNWLEGVQLLAAYAIMAIGFFYVG